MGRGSGRNGSKRRSIRHVIKGGVHRLATHRQVEVVTAPQITSDGGRAESATTGQTLPDPGHLPTNLGDPSDHQHWFRVGPLMCTILALSLAWILIVAWFVYKMPEVGK